MCLRGSQTWLLTPSATRLAVTIVVIYCLSLREMVVGCLRTQLTKTNFCNNAQQKTTKKNNNINEGGLVDIQSGCMKWSRRVSISNSHVTLFTKCRKTFMWTLLLVRVGTRSDTIQRRVSIIVTMSLYSRRLGRHPTSLQVLPEKEFKMHRGTKENISGRCGEVSIVHFQFTIAGRNGRVPVMRWLGQSGRGTN